MRRRAASLLAVTMAALAGACGTDPPATTQAAYCDATHRHRAELSRPLLAAAADVPALLGVYADMHAHAPLAIGREWAVVEALVRAAAGVDRNDPAALAELARSARLARTAADQVVAYTQQICGVLIGDQVPGSAPQQNPNTRDTIMVSPTDQAPDSVPESSTPAH